ncbi:helix-turn-helix transcriptional regulator [Allohahella marinimesophila]|uniref:HTH cro/C1-type domain-containing protein n=1 Tax=Allohahella marinimesophila TaxID=1054972 RepID=A0ABP7NVC5_9GAMM
MHLGSALRHLRKSKGLTLADIALRAGSHVGNLSRIERGSTMPSMDLLYRITASLDVSVSDVFFIVDNREPDELQLALNSLYIALPDRDRELLLAFGKLLRDQQDLPATADAVALPGMFVDSTSAASDS